MNWKYYNHAMIPNMPPHMEIDTTAIENGNVWEMSGRGTRLC